MATIGKGIYGLLKLGQDCLSYNASTRKRALGIGIPFIWFSLSPLHFIDVQNETERG